MAKKITFRGQFSKTLAEVFEDFVISKTAQGVSEITLATYRQHIRSISNHLDIQKPMESLTRKDLEAMVVSMFGRRGFVSGAHARPQSLRHERYVQPFRVYR